MPAEESSPVFYIRFWEEISSEVEPEHLEALRAALGAVPTATLMVDVSGRIPGDVEVLEFAAVMLGKFRGVAWDDYTFHCWTLAEIQSGAKVQGHSFFDYNGWYLERPIRPALPEGWHYPDDETAQMLHAELLIELPLGHLLHGKSVMTFAWRDGATDDVLFRHIDEPERFTVIHLSWLGRTEINAEHPRVEFDGTFDAFIAEEKRLLGT